MAEDMPSQSGHPARAEGRQGVETETPAGAGVPSPLPASHGPENAVSAQTIGARLVAETVAAREADIHACAHAGGRRVRGFADLLAPRIDALADERDAALRRCDEMRTDFDRRVSDLLAENNRQVALRRAAESERDRLRGLLEGALDVYQKGRDALLAERDGLRAALAPLREYLRKREPHWVRDEEDALVDVVPVTLLRPLLEMLL